VDTTLAQQVQWLVDRAQISDLLFSFARALDTRNYSAYQDNFTEDGFLELPDPNSTTGETITFHRNQMLDAVPKGIGRYSATHHLSANHQITISGDSAVSRSYLQAVHVSGAPTEHWDAGGWYDCEYRRTVQGWKFACVKLTAVWFSGELKSIRPDA
jgi:hypothetical protein